MWNTGLNKIKNTLDVAINVVDGEDNRFAIEVSSKKTEDWKSVVFPWCNNEAEVRQKAFRVRSLKSGKVIIYLFQDYQTNHICWSLNKGNVWHDRKRLNNGSKSSGHLPAYSAISIVIQGDRVWGFDSENENHTAQDILKIVGSVAGPIATLAG